MSTYSLDNLTTGVESFRLDFESCTFENCKIYALVGSNGCGKSTLLNTLGFMNLNWAGGFTFMGRAVDPRSSQGSLIALRRQVGYLQQSAYLFNTSVFNNVAYGMRIRGCSRAAVHDRVHGILERLELKSLTHRNAHRLSGGEAQRVALARVLVLDVAVYLLDEPTANVDKDQIQRVESLLKSICQERGVTIILSTHAQDQARRLADECLNIHRGRVGCFGVDNVFRGELTLREDDVREIAVAPDAVFKATSGVPGMVTVSIDPNAILLSKSPIESTALNRVDGVVAKLERHGSYDRVFLEAGCELCAVVSHRSSLDLGLKLGDHVFATFKASAVRVW